VFESHELWKREILGHQTETVTVCVVHVALLWTGLAWDDVQGDGELGEFHIQQGNCRRFVVQGRRAVKLGERERERGER